MTDKHRNDDGDKSEEKDYDYIFGFGSIINTDTHATWLGPSISSLPGLPARIKPTFGYKRGWFFRSKTGFTALGIIRSEGDGREGMNINGVMFRVCKEMMGGFDKREVGYDRVQIPLEYIEILSDSIITTADQQQNKDDTKHVSSTLSDIEPTQNSKIWIYVPQTSSYALPDEDHPILQSYVDTVLRGCLQWGGETMAKEFVATTTDWSPYFLNDTPSSRRPWLHRKQYEIIDKVLSETGGEVQTFFEERRHPEEFASAFLLMRMRGMWSVPRRNVCFTGREEELQRIHLAFTGCCNDSSFSTSPYELTTTATDSNNVTKRASAAGVGSVSHFEITGMGGVGKTQLATEYCHRHFPSYYGLIVWLTAQSAESVAAEYRRLVSDTTTTTSLPSSTTTSAVSSSENKNASATVIKDKDTDEIVSEVKARLYRLEVPWLLVFDNLEDRSLLDKFVPRGGTNKGHVLITTRLVVSSSSDQVMDNGMTTSEATAATNADDTDSNRITLRCFDPAESAELLKRSAGEHNVTGIDGIHTSAAAELANKLGHLPLALGVASAYMRRCDVDCSEYLSRYVALTAETAVSTSSLAALGQKAVESSLSLSLDAIRREETVAWEALRLLGWMGPGKITKVLLRSLLRIKNMREIFDREEEIEEERRKKGEEEMLKYSSGAILYYRLASWGSLGIGGSIAALSLISSMTNKRGQRPLSGRHLHFGAIAAAVGGALVLALTQNRNFRNNEKSKQPDKQQCDGHSSPSHLLRKKLTRSSNSSRRSLLLSSQSSQRRLSVSSLVATDNESISTSFSAVEYEQTDSIWNILKSFSLLTVKEGKGSMHRLLAQALRSSQDEKDGRRNLGICINTMNRLWSFKPENVGTWQDSIDLLEHVKAVVSYSYEFKNLMVLEASVLSREAGVFSAMALNRFEEAQFSLELSLKILDRAGTVSHRGSGGNEMGSEDDEDKELKHARAEALHELGRVFRYKGRLGASEEALLGALKVLETLDAENADVRRKVAATLHELGVIEEKKHNLDSATYFLRKALDIRLGLEEDDEAMAAVGGGRVIQADCASTLHQLAALEVARKPPCLDKAEELLQEALGLSMSIGQRAATLKQLARVAIRRGDLDVAERSLGLALELYIELYGENALHVNVAAVRFQQGALAFQRDQLEQAWTHYSECLRARRHVYAYVQGNHLEVATVLHELGRVAFSQCRKTKAREMLKDERAILDQLHEMSAGQRQRILQARRLTNLTWLRKCAKEMGDDDEARKFALERSVLKREMNREEHASKCSLSDSTDWPETPALQRESLRCRALARKTALACSSDVDYEEIEKLKLSIQRLSREIGRSPSCPLQISASRFQEAISESLTSSEVRTSMLKACDDFRDALRNLGVRVNDVVTQGRGSVY